MPLYTYRCSSCGNQFELRQSFYDEPIHICSVCEGEVRRVIQQVPVLFKGSGFYVTDNRSKSVNGSSNGKGPKSSEEASSTNESKKEEKSDRAAAKSENKTAATGAAKKE